MSTGNKSVHTGLKTWQKCTMLGISHQVWISEISSETYNNKTIKNGY